MNIKHIPVWITNADSDEQILPDLSVIAGILSCGRSTGPLVLRKALRCQLGQNTDCIYVKASDHHKYRRVRVQDVSDTKALTESGPRAGEEILLSALPTGRDSLQ